VTLFVVIHVAGIVCNVANNEPEVPDPALGGEGRALRELLDIVREEVDNTNERTVLAVDERHLDGGALLCGVEARRVL